MLDNSTVQVQCITQCTLPSSPRPLPHPQYNVNTILHMSAGDIEGSEVSSPLQNITITTSSHNSSQRRLYGEPLRAPAGRRGRGGGEECTLPGHRVPDVVGVTLVNTW